MLLSRKLIAMFAMFVFPLALLTGASPLKSADCEDTLSRHMVGEALLAAHFVALAEKMGMTPDAINTILKSISEKSAIQEFWITDTVGHAYLTILEWTSRSARTRQSSPRHPHFGRYSPAGKRL
jgi:hypothetical protein